jgi:hypothetical protein
MHRSHRKPGNETLPLVEVVEGRILASVSPSVPRRDVIETLRTHTVLTVEAGTLGQPITFDVTVLAAGAPPGNVDLYSRGKLLQHLYPRTVDSPDPRLYAVGATYTIAAGTAGAEMFGVGPHAVTAQFVAIQYASYPSAAVAVFRVKRPQLAPKGSGVSVATLSAGSGPALHPGQTATVQYNAYLAASYHQFYSTDSQTPDMQSFTVDASPEQVIPGLDAGAVGMQAGETRAIYIPYQLGYGTKGGPHVPRRANLVYLVTLVAIGD